MKIYISITELVVDLNQRERSKVSWYLRYTFWYNLDIMWIWSGESDLITKYVVYLWIKNSLFIHCYIAKIDLAVATDVTEVMM